MRIGNRLFPYPILNNNALYSQYKDSSFTLFYNEETNEDNFVLNDLVCELKNDYLKQIINEGKAQTVIVVECSGTMFRKPYVVAPNTKNEITIPLSELNGKYSVSAYIVATQNFDYISDSFLDDYKGYTFQIEKNDILAIDDGYVNRIDYDDEKDTNNPSIFIVIKDKNIADGTMKFDYDQSKIEIRLPENEWNIYQKTKRVSKLRNIYFSLIAIPALAYSLLKLRDENNEGSVDSLRIENKWFSVFAEAYKKIHGKELDDEDFFVKKIDLYSEAQLIFDSPIAKAINNLFELTMVDFGGSDDGN